MSFSANLRELQTLSGQQWMDRATRTLPRALTVVLVIAIAWQLVQLTWLLLERRTPEDSSAMVMGPPPPSATRKGIDVQAIASAHIFGEAKEEQVAPEDAKETQMNLVLSAVFAANDPTKGVAVIGDSPQSAKVYAVRRYRAPGNEAAFRVPGSRHPRAQRPARDAALPRPNMAGLAITRTAAAPRPGNVSVRRQPAPHRRDEPDGLRRSRAPPAGVRQRRAARLSRLSGPQPPAVRQARPAAGRPGAVDQWHPAR